MATRNYTIEQDANTQTIAWSGLLNGDDGVPIEAKDFADYCIQFSGTFGAGGTILWEGSNLAGTGFAISAITEGIQPNRIERISGTGLKLGSPK